MAKLPDVYGTRPTPRFGGLQKAGPVVAPVVDNGYDSLARSIDGFAEEYERFEVRNAKYDVTDAMNKLKEAAIDQRAGDNGWFHVKQGDINETFYKDRLDIFTQSKDEIGSTLSERARKIYNQDADGFGLGVQNRLIQHITGEREDYNTKIYDDGLKANINSAAAAWADKGALNAILFDQNKLITDRLDDIGINDKKSVDLAHREAASDVHTTVISSAVSQGNHTYAKDWFKENKKNMTADDIKTVESLLKRSGIRAASQDNVDDYVQKGLDETTALKEAKKIDDAEIRDATVDRIKTVFGEESAALDRKQKGHGERARTTYADSIDVGMTPQDAYDSIDPIDLENMDGGERISLQSRVRIDSSGETVKTDKKELYRLRNLYRNDRLAFLDYNLMQSSHLLSGSDFEEFVKLQTDEKALMVSRNKAQYMKQAAGGAGIDPKDLTDDGSKGDEARAYYNRVDDELESIKQQTGKDPTLKDIEEITDRLNIEVIRERSIWPLGKFPWRLFGGDIEERAGAMEIEGVPSELIDELALALKDAGEDVTETNIRYLYYKEMGIPIEVPVVEPKKTYRRYAR